MGPCAGGTTDTYNHYHAGWAWAGNTPFKYFKQSGMHTLTVFIPTFIHISVRLTSCRHS